MKKKFYLLPFVFFAALAVALIGAGVNPAPTRHRAQYWKNAGKGSVKCLLCPRECVIRKGKRGFCQSRINKGGALYSLTYGRPVAAAMDPIEKKPFFHVTPAEQVLSIATAGCNMRCLFCQNWRISQTSPDEAPYMEMSPREVVKEAAEKGSRWVVYTYTEPTVFYEYMIDICREAKKKGLKNAMHSCGYINPAPLKKLLKYMDAVNIDLKGFNDDFYRKMGFLADIEVVLETLKIIKKSGVWLEITNLVIPGQNDSPDDIKRMCEWIKKELGPDVPLHFSRFYPAYRLKNLPPTPGATLKNARAIALEAGLNYVYIGNAPELAGENTKCPGCGKTLIKRTGYNVRYNL
ncbi:MAG: AmmeMemoRadiSam system radical SAM enzyme, partial [Elusimicrobia bacterium]|nr:AmmeMemoRadiSam system radical SAM enzyme [Elusimicrobiota bacterium]